MADKFIPAVEELGTALVLGEDLDIALVEIAADHDVKPEALRYRAQKAYGDLATHRDRTAAASTAIAKMTREHVEYERDLKERRDRLEEKGIKYTLQGLREADAFWGRDIGRKRD